MPALTQENEIMETLRQECPEILRNGYVTQNTEKLSSVDQNQMSATFAILTRAPEDSEESRNRHGNRVLITEDERGQGFQTEHWERNPQVFLDHVYIPMARGADKGGQVYLEKTPEKITSTAFFSSKVELSDQAFLLISEGLLTMASVGFRPILGEKLPTLGEDDLPRNLTRFESRWRTFFDFVQAEMYEWSVVPIGADRGSHLQELRQEYYEKNARIIESGELVGVKLNPVYKQLLEQFRPEEASTVQSYGSGFNLEELFQQLPKDRGATIKVMEAATWIEINPAVEPEEQTPEEPEKNPPGGVEQKSSSGNVPAESGTTPHQTDRDKSAPKVQKLDLKAIQEAIAKGFQPVNQEVTGLRDGWKKSTGRVS